MRAWFPIRKMPDSCYDCPFYILCAAIVRYKEGVFEPDEQMIMEMKEKRRDDCPMREME